jgi:S-adenosylmethionine:tRNA ribosyltransferase-isomerase
MAHDELGDYDFDLPEHRIAQTPLENRASSKLLHVDLASDQLHDLRFRDAISLLHKGDVLVVNDTRVSALRLFGAKTTGAQVDALLLRDLGDGRFTALVKPGRRLKTGYVIEFEAGLTATITAELADGQREIQFQGENTTERLRTVGTVPLPPYITTKLENPERYQTVYANEGGSVAAPTAGLHFTPEILQAIRDRGITIGRVTLDVGLDTFRPIAAEKLEDHHMHGEWCSVPPETVEMIANAKGRVIAVGTTSVRTLESFAIGKRRLESGRKLTSIFIQPGYDFQIVDGMFTNFHMPRTTMLLMISAMAGKDMIQAAYRHALQSDYRFLSFGDSMLILNSGSVSG